MRAGARYSWGLNRGVCGLVMAIVGKHANTLLTRPIYLVSLVSKLNAKRVRFWRPFFVLERKNPRTYGVRAGVRYSWGLNWSSCCCHDHRRETREFSSDASSILERSKPNPMAFVLNFIEANGAKLHEAVLCTALLHRVVCASFQSSICLSVSSSARFLVSVPAA